MCGGTRRPAPASFAAQGLSPRVRGNPLSICPLANPLRSIPACAGEPRGQLCNGVAAEVYPRVCGGTRLVLLPSSGGGGLSPRVRGNRLRLPPLPAAEGSIPACAGEPPRRGRVVSEVGVYPRVCGGTGLMAVTVMLAMGLSPRVRGNLDAGADAGQGMRSIPACAGEPIAAMSSSVSVKVYPRVCGGTLADSPLTAGSPGLSPRVRGNQRRHPGPDDRIRSIPACAGEPLAVAVGVNVFRVYPRVCGGTRATCSARCAMTGLSPRVRGNPAGSGPPHPGRRSIPACAGEPVPAGR